MAEYLTNDTDLKSVAGAIRAKTGKTDAIAYPDGFVSAINNIATGAEKEVWVLNNADAFSGYSGAIQFTSNGTLFYGITSAGAIALFYWLNTEGSETFSATDPEAEEATFIDQAYRKLIFDTPPTGDLLTWLQANGVKQTANLAVQPSKSVSVTSNGTTTVVPDAPYDGVASVEVTTNVPGVQWYSPVS